MIKKIQKKQTREQVDDVHVTDDFLNHIEQDMDKYPESIQPITKNEMDEIAKLVEDVDIG